MFSAAHKDLALNFAKLLGARSFEEAHVLCSSRLRQQLSSAVLAERFNTRCPPEYGDIELVELLDDEDSDDYDFIYVSIYIPKWGNDEAVIVNRFETENGELRIDDFEIGRP